jgi:hypothetical protein
VDQAVVAVLEQLVEMALHLAAGLVETEQLLLLLAHL